MALWIARNYRVSDTPAVPLNLFDASLPFFPDVLRGAAVRLWQWTEFGLSWNHAAPFLPFLRGAVFVLFASAAAALLPGFWRCLRGQWKRPALSDWRPCAVFGGFALTYLLMLLAILSASQSDVPRRYLTPLYIPLSIAAAVAIDRLFAVLGLRSAGAGPRVGAAAAAAALFLWLAGQAVPLTLLIRLANDGALMYAGPSPWGNSETLRHIRRNPIDGAAYSGDPFLVAMYNKGIAAYGRAIRRRKSIADAAAPGSAAAGQKTLEPLLADIPEGAWLVWLQDMSSDRLAGLAYLRTLPFLEPAAEFADGGIYRVRKRNHAAPRANPYRKALDSIVSGAFGAPAIRAVFDVYRHGDDLIYFRKSCVADDLQDKFFLHVHARNAADLPAERAQYGFENLDFYFPEYGMIVDGNCVAVRRIPGYASTRIATGQYISGGKGLWHAEARPGGGPRSDSASARPR